MEGSLNLPSFLFLGPDKAGSSWMFQLLREHRQCFVPEAKDLYFFDQNFSKGFDWYGNFFKGATREHLAVGELSHDYLFSREAAQRILSHVPDARLFCCLRDPSERSFSHYLYLVRSGIVNTPFREALSTHPEILENSNYISHVPNYLSANHFKVFLFDELKKDSHQFARELCEFLGIEEPDTVPGPVRVAAKPRSRGAAKFGKQTALLMRRLGMQNLLGRLKRSSLQALFFKPYTEEDRPTLTPEDREFLRGHFQAGIEELAQLLEKDLSAWLS